MVNESLVIGQAKRDNFSLVLWSKLVATRNQVANEVAPLA